MYISHISDHVVVKTVKDLKIMSKKFPVAYLSFFVLLNVVLSFLQIVVCQNTARSESIVGGVMIHEMIHMFDYCRNELDFKNIDHLACTEIRAANLTHCSFMSAWVQGSASPLNIKKQHQVVNPNQSLSRHRVPE